MASPSTAAADPSPSSPVRAAARIAVLALWFITCLPFHLITRATGHSNWPRRFLKGAAAICGADARCEGKPAEPATLLVANHVSWLDIMVLAGATGCAFVSKAEVRDHPVLRWFADQNETIYIDRADRRALHGQAESVREGLRRRRPLALFPEGTVGDGGRLLPFKPSLLSAVAPPPRGVQVRAVAIDYGQLARVIGWGTGEPGKANLLRVLGRKGRIPVTIRLLDPIAPTGDRKQLARSAHDAIASVLAPSGMAPARV